jgi:L-seryl-tRNA(Ser) seleniumtransferase
VIVSRGQVVEIGGGFRIPEVLARSGAALVEVGTTNRTYLSDYERAIGERTRILLSVHRSNFRLSGFVHDVELSELVALARSRGLAVVDDLGSGTLLDTARFGLGAEPTVLERIRAGADLVTFSGDKLLGGPQAGILAGRREAVARVKRHPLLRALRVDKVTFAGLHATLVHYLKNEATSKVPIWMMISASVGALEARASKWVEFLRSKRLDASVIETESTVGGGSLPGETLPTRAVALDIPSPDKLASRLRRNNPPIIARIEENRIVFDPRTVLPNEDDALLSGIERAARGQPCMSGNYVPHTTIRP